MPTTQPARGTRDFLPEDVRRREHVIGVIRGVYERYGFEPLETPAIENIETLTGKYGDEGAKLIFKILKRGEHEARGEADLALRYDLTVPLARVVAEYQARLPKYFKRYQVQPVWRADRPARGRFREFCQCDLDALGSTSMVVEAEVLAAVSDVLRELGFADFVIRLNHRQVLAGMLDAAGVPVERHPDALVALDKLDKIGRVGVARELADRGLATEGTTRLLDVFAAAGPASAVGEAARQADTVSGPTAGLGGTGEPPDNQAVLSRLRAFVGAHPAGERGLAELEEVLSLSAATSAAGRLRIDPSLARGLSYYTGVIMEAAVPDLAGSLGGGGRYDQLVGMFLGRDVPACGFSLGLERILVVMAERGMFPPSLPSAACDVLVTQWNEAQAADALALARELRDAGLRAEVFPEADKLGKQFRYASARGVPFVVVSGDDERARGEVAVKNLVTGEQTAVPRQSAGGWIRERLATAPRAAAESRT